MKILDTQIQPAGVDLRLKNVWKINKNTSTQQQTSCKQKQHQITEPLAVDTIKVHKYQDHPHYFLQTDTYLIEYHEYFTVPRDLAGFVLSRSTLLRIGNNISTGLFDPGFNGYGKGHLQIHTPTYLEKDVPIAQVIFYQLNPLKLNRNIAHLYDGNYQDQATKVRQ